MTTQEINESLKVVNIKGKCFKADPKVFKDGYYKVSQGFALYSPFLGYMAFKDSPFVPYAPAGGRKALQSILDAGGMVDFSLNVWIDAIIGGDSF